MLIIVGYFDINFKVTSWYGMLGILYISYENDQKWLLLS